MPSHPTKIGKYNVEGVIGQGGMGVVYKAVDSQIGRYVAIKMITGNRDDPSLPERFKSEARSTGSLQCPNIVTVYDFGEQDGNPYLVMQFLEGSSLDSLIQKGVSLTLSERLGIIIDVCNGLSYAHQRGVIHRDIKPGNIMVLQDGANDGMGVIVDFGIARIAGDTRNTKTDQIVGSVHYMSAEQLQGKELDNRTDIYATGVVLFQLLTGALPFDSPDTAATLLKIVNDPPPPLSTYLKEYPVELEAIVSKVLAKKREERYATAEDLAFDLRQVQGHAKSETVAQLVRRAEASVSREEWTRAREQLQQALRIDRQNTQAQKLMNAVQERLRQQQQIEQARTLRSQADEAYTDQRYDDALRLVDQAVTLDETNSDLLAFRESVRAAKDRATGLRRTLRRAEAALQDGDLDEAQSAVNDAFKIDPHDTQAKALKVIISQHAEERSRQEQLRKLLDRARNQIVARDLTGAFATLRTAEALDPTSNELHSVAKMALSALEQERRRSETEELRRQIEGALVQEDYATAVARAEEGLRRFPQEQSLLRLKALAEAQRLRVEQKKFVREQVAAASSLIDSGRLSQALTVLETALQRAPGNSELETLLSTVRDRVVAAESEQQKLQLLAAAVAEGKRILQERGARSAREFLDAYSGQYSEFPQLRDLYNAVRARETLDALDSKLAAEPNPAKRVQLAEEAVRSNPDNHWIRQRLADVQQVKTQISAVIDRAQRSEAGGRFSEAAREWQQLCKRYPEVPEFEVQVRRVASLQAKAKSSTGALLTTASSTVKESPEAGKSALSLSATRVLDSAVAPGIDLTPKKSAPVGREAAAAVRDTTPPPTRNVALRIRSVVDLQRRLENLNVGLRIGSAIDLLRRPENLFARPKKYVAVSVAVIVLAVGWYALSRWGKASVARQSIAPSLQVHIITNPSDSVVTSGSQPVSGGMVSLLPGASVTVEVVRLGYKTKQEEVRQESDGKIVLEPEPLHLSIQTSEKTGTVELDGQKITDLSDGNMDEYDLVADGNDHKLSVSARGKRLFAVEFQAVAGSPPQVKTFVVKDMFLMTSLGGSAKLYAGDFLKDVRVGDQKLTVSPSGTDLSLSAQNHEIKFGEGDEQGSLEVDISNAPTLAVHSTQVDGQVQVRSNVEGATLTVDGTTVKRQRRGWEVRRPPGTYNFALSAEGYEPQMWKMTMRGRQTLSKNVDLKAKVKLASMAALVIAGGTPGTEVEVDGKRIGELDANGNLQLPNVLTAGQHSILLAKLYFENHTFEVSAKLPEVRITDAKLTAWPTLMVQTSPADAVVKYKRVGDSQVHQAGPSARLRLPSGQYDLLVEASGFQTYKTELRLVPGEDMSIPLKLVPIPDYEFQDAAQVIHEGPWVRSKDPHSFVYLKRGLLNENLVFTKPGRNLFWSKKVEWVIEASEGSGHVQYVLDGSKMVRKLVIEENVSDQKEAKVDAAAVTQGTSLSVHIQVEGSHVQVSNDKGVVLDDYNSPEHNFSGGRIGIKTESQFVVRNE
jgi:serine/threonine-protein kinase